MNDQTIEQEIQAKGLTAPRVTPADIEANIASEHYFTAGDGYAGVAALTIEQGGHIQPPEQLDLLTFCVLILQNGFTVTGESACASPENFDEELGRKIARQNAIQKVWPLMGYALKQQLHSAANQPPAPGAAHPGYSAMQPHQQRVVDEYIELDSRLSKLISFFDTPLFSQLADDEKELLVSQGETMQMYSTILLKRILTFTPAA